MNRTRNFTHAIVRKPSPELIHGITTAQLGLPDYNKALLQHRAYTNALRQCGLEVIELPADRRHPDATFIEDVALCTPAGAVITRPGAPSRQGETEGIWEALSPLFERIERITAPGTLEGGDVMMVGDHYFIGLSERTNAEGARQLIAILESWGLTGSAVPLREVLHLKTGVSYLENNRLLVCGEFTHAPAFAHLQRIEVDADEAYAANALWVNGRVLVPAGFPKTKASIEAAGYETIALDVSEFQKVDGGLSCLSLRVSSTEADDTMKTTPHTAELIQNAVLRMDENTDRIKKCLRELSEEEIWRRPNEASNSVGNLILHLCGNIRQWAISSLGQRPDVRERDAEFAAREGHSKAELFARLLETVEEAVAVLKSVDEHELLHIRKVQAYDVSGIGIIMHVVEHYSYHTGQIAFWTKLLRDKDLGFYAGVDLG